MSKTILTDRNDRGPSAISRRAAPSARVNTAADRTPQNQLEPLRALTALRCWRATECAVLSLERDTSCVPHPIPPMLPTPARPFHRPGWVYEEKYDGWRIIAHKQGDRVRLLTRHGIDYTRRFRELAAAIASVPAFTVILDGEVAVFDRRLLSRLDLLQRPDPSLLMTPPIYIAFDCLYRNGRDLRHDPLWTRRRHLEDLIDGQHRILPARRLPAHGLEAWEEVQWRGYEGLVAKDDSSTYPGGRTRLWLKVKQSSHRQGYASGTSSGSMVS